jgi:hypothetical protein
MVSFFNISIEFSPVILWEIIHIDVWICDMSGWTASWCCDFVSNMPWCVGQLQISSLLLLLLLNFFVKSSSVTIKYDWEEVELGVGEWHGFWLVSCYSLWLRPPTSYSYSYQVYFIYVIWRVLAPSTVAVGMRIQPQPDISWSHSPQS